MKHFISNLIIPLQLISVLTLSSCSFSSQKKQNQNHQYQTTYAKGFLVNKQEGYIEISIRNPWDTTRILNNYILIHRGNAVPSDIPSGSIVFTPVQKVAAYASLHCRVLEELGVLETLVGVCDPQYIRMPFVEQKLKEGKIIHLGQSGAPNVEQLIELSPDVIMTSPYENVSYGRVGKLGIPLIECADYMEQTPLGRAEWIRFHSLFFEKEALGDSLFAQTVANYQSIQALAAKAATRPTIFSELKTGPTWYVPGGDSYMAHLYRDAGADYIWKDDFHLGSITLSPEEVFEKASDADFWLIKYYDRNPLTYDRLATEYHLYPEFKAFKEKKIYGCNGAYCTYFEEMPVHPDRMLKDLVNMLHPELMDSYQPYYIKPIQ